MVEIFQKKSFNIPSFFYAVSKLFSKSLNILHTRIIKKVDTQRWNFNWAIVIIFQLSIKSKIKLLGHCNKLLYHPLSTLHQYYLLQYIRSLLYFSCYSTHPSNHFHFCNTHRYVVLVCCKSTHIPKLII